MGVLVLKGLVGLAGLHRTIELQLLQHYWLGHRLGYWLWFAWDTKRDHSVIFEIASKYCISESFVDDDSYFISSRDSLYLQVRWNGVALWIEQNKGRMYSAYSITWFGSFEADLHQTAGSVKESPLVVLHSFSPLVPLCLLLETWSESVSCSAVSDSLPPHGL